MHKAQMRTLGTNPLSFIFYSSEVKFLEFSSSLRVEFFPDASEFVAHQEMSMPIEIIALHAQ